MDLKKIIQSAKDILPSGIICLVSDERPLRFTASMARSPIPNLNWALGENFRQELLAAISLNPSVHDGAMVFMRDERANSNYHLFGWSHRLLPPALTTSRATNRGSAFCSSEAMSAVEGVDLVCSWSGFEIALHRNGVTECLGENSK